MFIVFEVTGVLGYMSLGDEAYNVDLFPMRPALKGYKDSFMTFAKIFLGVAVYIAVLVRVISIKTQFFKLQNKPLTWRRNVLFTIVTMYIPGLIGFVYPGVANWVSL